MPPPVHLKKGTIIISFPWEKPGEFFSLVDKKSPKGGQKGTRPFFSQNAF
jgi:hypothetical protein